MSITLIKNIQSEYQTKHIDIRHHYIRELVNEKKLIIKWVYSSEMLTDRMTKRLSTKIFTKYQALLGIAIN